MAYTTIDNPELHFQTKLYTGNGSSTQAITLDGSENMQPDWIWIKNRTDGHWHNLNDSVRGAGAGQVLRSNTNSSEGGTSGHVSSFDSDGFTVAAGTSNAEEVNTSSDNYVAWNWKAGTTSGISGSPSITPSGYSFSQTAGFSIIAYTGNASVGATIPHGLGVAPAVIIFKNRDSNVKWVVYHHKNTSAPETDHLQLNDTTATSDDDSILNDTAPGSSVITMKTSSSVNSNSVKYVAYCFSEIKGYSKFGSYTGNGNADGAFVYTGFRPAWIMIKKSSGTEDWSMYDAKRNVNGTTNTLPLLANFSDGETNLTGKNMDILSNGFKIRTSNGELNLSGATYIYLAFAESPFVNSKGVPTNGR